MYIGIKIDTNNDIVTKFMNNWENPTTPYAIAVENTNVEFKIRRYNDFVLISQKNFFDVVSKYLFFGATFLMIISWIIGYYIQHTTYTFAGFILGAIILFFSGLFMSPYFRFFLIKLRLRTLGYKGICEYLEKDDLLDKILFECENGAKRNISIPKK